MFWCRRRLPILVVDTTCNSRNSNLYSVIFSWRTSHSGCQMRVGYDKNTTSFCFSEIMLSVFTVSTVAAVPTRRKNRLTAHGPGPKTQPSLKCLTVKSASPPYLSVLPSSRSESLSLYSPGPSTSSTFVANFSFFGASDMFGTRTSQLLSRSNYTATTRLW